MLHFVAEFGFVVEGHEFDSYPKKMILDIKNWDWFLENEGKDSEDEGKKVRGSRRRKRKKGAENDDDEEEEWSGESEDERVLMDRSRKAPRAKYTTRSKDRGKPNEMSSTRTRNRDDDEEEEEDEDDETLGGFVVDDENLEEEEEGGELEEDDEEEELEDEDEDE